MHRQTQTLSQVVSTLRAEQERLAHTKLQRARSLMLVWLQEGKKKRGPKQKKKTNQKGVKERDPVQQSQRE